MSKAVIQAILVAAIIAAGLALLHDATAERIAAHARARTTAQMRALFPEAASFQEAALPNNSAAQLHLHARWQALDAEQQPLGSVLDVTTPRGYSGNIRLLVGIRRDGTLAGARVTDHRETPGLGDAIETRNSNWIEQFNGLSLRQPDTQGWRLSKHGGQIDAITSATITSGAVTRAVRDSLQIGVDSF